MAKTILSVKQRPPKWASYLTAALALLMGSRAILIDSLPIENTDLKDALSGWFEYVLNATGVIMGIITIFTGTAPEKPDTDNVL